MQFAAGPFIKLKLTDWDRKPDATIWDWRRTDFYVTVMALTFFFSRGGNDLEWFFFKPS